MNYLELSGKQLPCQFIKKPHSLFEAFEQLFSAFECFTLGDEDVTGGNAGDEDFFQYSALELLEDFEKAMQHARRHSDMINRFCEEIDKGCRPSMKVGIRLTSLVERGTNPTKKMLTEWDAWFSEFRDYVAFFEESLLLDYLYSEEGYRDRGETKPVQKLGDARRIELELSATNATPLAADQHVNDIPPDGLDEDRMILVLGSHEFGPFTPTQFDVVQMMWNHRQSKWSESDAFFLFNEKFGWVQTAESPFGKHQTDIKTVFVAKGFELPWRRLRGLFVWRGLVKYSKRSVKKPQDKRGPERKVSRGKKR